MCYVIIDALANKNFNLEVKQIKFTVRVSCISSVNSFAYLEDRWHRPLVAAACLASTQRNRSWIGTILTTVWSSSVRWIQLYSGIGTGFIRNVNVRMGSQLL